jgi:hypothetical protein
MSKLTHGGDLEWAVWSKDKATIYSILKTREAEEKDEVKAPRPEDYTFVGR